MTHRARWSSAETRQKLVAGLNALAAAEEHPGVIGPADASAAGKRRIVWLFKRPGESAGRDGALDCDGRFPVFAAAFDEVCGLLDSHLEHSLREVVFTGGQGLLDHATYAQSGLFALQIGLARLLDSAGIRPDVVIGHSIGEVAAAHLAGVFDLPDACRLVAARAGLMGGLPAGGAMTAIQATEDELREDLDRYGHSATIAALNTPDSTVISGPAALVAEIGATWADRGRKTKPLVVSHAFHSPLMEPMLADFTEAIGDLTYHRPATTLISNLTGLPADEDIATPDYWVRQVRGAVRFHPAVAQVADESCVYLELGPSAVLAAATQHTLAHLPGTPEPVVVPALTGKQPEARAFAHALARLHVSGVDVDWTDWFPADPVPRVVDLPTYAFQRERFWLSGGGSEDPAALGLVAAGHPLLGAAVEFADRSGCLLTGRLSKRAGSWLGEHAVAGTVLLPGTALLEWALRAADEVGCAAVEELALQAPVMVPEAGALRVQVAIGAAGEDGRRDVQVYTRPDGRGGETEESWVRHATGVLGPGVAEEAEGLAGVWPPAAAEPVDIEGFYERMASAGYEYGPAFQGLRSVWRAGPELLAEVTLPEQADQRDGFGIHPALLDAALHPVLAARPDGESSDGRLWVPFTWRGVSLRAVGATALRVRLSPLGEQAEQGLRVTVSDPSGVPVLTVDSVRMRPVDARHLLNASQRRVRGLFTVEWLALPVSGGRLAGVAGGDGVTLGGEVADLAGLVGAVEGGAGVPSVVVAVVGVAAGEEGLAVVERVLGLVQGWLAEPRLAEARLVLVTRAAVAVSGGVDVEVAAAGVWGLVRSVQSENPGRFVLLDVDTEPAHVMDRVRDAAARAMAADEPQVALRGDRLLVPRMVAAGAPVELIAPVGRHAWRLGTTGTATVEGVSVVGCPEALEPLGAGQVRVSVRAAGINFRDVLIAVGMYPDEGQFAGSEGAGVVVEVGSGVVDVVVGDRVMGLFGGGFGPVVVADARMVVRMPAGWSFQRAAGVPVVFLTAWYGLVELAGLRAGESVLIHAATGGVGMAAVKIARHLGAQVYATASPANTRYCGAGFRRRPSGLLPGPGLRGRRSAKPPAAEAWTWSSTPDRTLHRRVAAAVGRRRAFPGDG